MPKERGQEWEHVKALNKKESVFKSSVTIATSNSVNKS